MFACSIRSVVLFALLSTLAPPSHGQAQSKPTTLKDVLGDSFAERQFEQSLSPYLTASAGEGVGLVKSLTEPEGSGARREYRVGKDLVMMPPASVTEDVSVRLPEGYWVNFWTGAQSSGGNTFSVELAAGSLPIWARGGSVIERRTGGYGGRGISFERVVNDSAKACGATCLLDVMPPYTSEQPEVTADADGRTLTRSGTSLGIEGKPARLTVRWRFSRVADVRVNGVPVPVQSSPEGYYATFDHVERSAVEWTVQQARVRLY